MPMPALSIRLFGPFEATINGEPLPRLRSRKGQWLLALLALRSGRPVERAWLAGVLWPETTEENALVSLRQTLVDLRRALGPEAARITSPTTKTLCFDPAGVFVDALEAEAALKQGDPASLQRAISLHQKPFLEDCLEEWALSEREVRQRDCIQALQALADEALTRSAFAEAVTFLRRVVAADPYQENAQRALMSALAASGDWGGAMLAYRTLRLLLHHELKAEPAAQTQALYRRLRSEARNRGEKPEEISVPMNSERNRLSFSPAGALPRPLTELIGRQQEIVTVTALMHRSCLVTLMGPGGVGKTRLAICVGEEWAEDGTDGVWFVDLAPLTDAALVPQSVAAVLGARDEPGRSVMDMLMRALRDRNLLLILDNCEHVLDACAELAARLLSECRSLRLLTTSRHALRVTGETVYTVPSLSVPSVDAGTGRDAASGADAVRLFVERAESVSPGFALTEANAPFIAQICRRLDGIPLAIELAAARVRMLAPDQIAARLDDRFRLLTQGNRAALPRQQTLRAALDWSYELLTETERLLFARLSVFAGGWTLAAAEAVCAAEDDADSVFDVLTALEEKSLVAVSQDEGCERRYRLLETFRQYAKERLQETGNTMEVVRRHRAWAISFADGVLPHWRGPENVLWLDRLEADHDNLRAALDSCGEDRDTVTDELRLVGALWMFWMDRAHYREGLARLTRALERAGNDATSDARLLALNGIAALASPLGDLPAARRAMEEALALARRSDHPKVLDNCLHNLANVVYAQGEYLEAQALWQESYESRRRQDDRVRLPGCLNNLGLCAYNAGDYARANDLHEEALLLAREMGNDHGYEAALAGLGSVALAERNMVAATSYYEQGLVLAQELGDKDSECDCLTGLARADIVMGEFSRAGFRLRACLTAARDAGLTPRVLDALDNVTDLALAQGNIRSASLLSGGCEELRVELMLPRLPQDQARSCVRTTHLNQALGANAVHAAREKSRVISQEQAISLALEIIAGNSS